MKKRSFLGGLAVIAAIAALPQAGAAQEVTLRLHQFLPPQAPVPQQILKPWAERVAQASDGVEGDRATMRMGCIFGLAGCNSGAGRPAGSSPEA